MPLHVVQLLVVDIRSTSNPCTDQDGEKWKRADDRMLSAAFLENDGNGTKLQVQYSIAEACVESHEETYRGSK